jgi:uncharacterized protein
VVLAAQENKMDQKQPKNYAEYFALFCEHANEVPSFCPCTAECYCKQQTCKKQADEVRKISKEDIQIAINKKEEEAALRDLDPDSFGGTDFPDWEPDSFGGTDFSDWDPISSFDDQVKELYTTNPNLNGNDNWIQTHMGYKFFPEFPEQSPIEIEDIAHALSNQCRFTGHTQEHYSVAQHCLLVSYLCSSENALQGLLHDASETYIADIASPVKRLPQFAGYRELEKKIQTAIFRRFGLPEEDPADVKRADLMALAMESNSFMFPLHPDWKTPAEVIPFVRLIPLAPAQVKADFLRRFTDLGGYSKRYESILKKSQ